MLEKTLEGPLDCKETKSVNPKGNQSWISTGRTDAEVEALIFWPSDEKSWLIGKDPDSGENWRQEKGMTEDEMIGWHHRLNEHEFEQAPGDGEGQGSLVCCSPWGLKESEMTKRLNNNNFSFFFYCTILYWFCHTSTWIRHVSFNVNCSHQSERMDIG